MTSAKWNTQIELPADPSTALEAATKQYVDNGLATKAASNNATLTGVPTAPTAALNNNTTQLATTAFVLAQLNALNSFGHDMTLAGDLLPDADNVRSLGSPTLMWKDVYIGPGSLYLNGQKVLEDTESGTIRMTADANQNIAVQTQGTGDVELNPLGTGVIQLKGNVMFDGASILRSSDGLSILFDDSIEFLPGAGIIGGLNVDGNAVWHAGNFNPALKLDAATYTAADVFAKVKTLDGAGSGLDADYLGGYASSSYLRKDAGGQTIGTGVTNQDIILTLANPGVGYANGFTFTRTGDGAGIHVTEYAADSTLYEMWMYDNPDTATDIFSWRFQDWQGGGGAYQPLQISNKQVRFIGSDARFYAPINQSTGPYFTTADPTKTNNTKYINYINDYAKLKVSGSGTVGITNLNLTGYTGTNGAVMWIVLTAANTFEWGYGRADALRTAVETGLPVSTSAVTLQNGMTVTFSSTTTGVAGDTFQWRNWRKPTTTLSDTTIAGTLDVSQNGNFQSTMSVAGDATFSGGVVINKYSGGLRYNAFSGGVFYAHGSAGAGDNVYTLTRNGSSNYDWNQYGKIYSNNNEVWHGGNFNPADKLGVTATAAAATKLATARTFSMSGVVAAVGVTFDGTGNVALVTTMADGSLSIAKTSGLQSALDAKLDATAYTAADVLTKIKTVDGTGTGLDADLLDGLEASVFLRNDIANTSDVRLSSVSGRGLRFWDNNAYKIFMSAVSDGSYGGRIAGESISDYNMYFRMAQSTGANRGFVFESDYGTKLFAINPDKVRSNLNIQATGFEGPLTGNVTGNADTASKLATARNVSLSGVVTAAAVLFDGSGNLVLNTAIANDALSIAQVNGLQAAIDAKISSSLIGAANGIVPLGSDSLIPSIYLPSYVDDVIEAADYESLPATGVAGKIYVTLDDSRQYRWGGSAYTEMLASPGTSDNVIEGSSNLYFTSARVLAVLSGAVSTIATVDLTANRALIANAAGKVAVSAVTDVELGYLSGVTSGLQAQINAKLASSSYTAADVLAKLLTVDGAASGLDADLLDGQDGAYYLNAANLTGTLNASRLPAFTGDVTTVAGSSATTIANNVVSLGKLAQVATASFLGRSTAGTGNVEAMTAAQAKTALVLVKGDVGLGNVDNTSDANKPVSTAQQTALNDKVSITATGLGHTGNKAFDSTTNTAALWSALPVGYARMMNGGVIGTGGGTPNTSYGYFFKVANRDTLGGWAGIWIDYSGNNNLYVGATQDNATLPTWRKVWTDANDGAGSTLDADLLDGQHGSYYQNATNLTAGTLDKARLPTQAMRNDLEGLDPITGLPLTNFWSDGGASQLKVTSNTAGSTGFPTEYGATWSFRYSNSANSSSYNRTFDLYRAYNANDFHLRGYDGNGAALPWAKIWTNVNDGGGSGLDADLLDGQEGAYYTNAANLTGSINDARLSGNVALKNNANTFTQRQYITAGSSTFNGDFLTLTPNDYGVGKPSLFFKKDTVADKWTIGLWDTAANTGTLDLAVTTLTKQGNTIWHAGNDGTGSGLDADKLDGQEGSYYQNASNINAGTIAKAYLPALVKADVGLGNVDNTSDANKPVSTATQTALNLKLDATAKAVGLSVADTRAVATTPATMGTPGLGLDFKSNTTEGLADGGSYFGELTFRPWGIGPTDWSGGPTHQLGFTSNGNLWHRSGTDTTFGAWAKFWDSAALPNPATLDTNQTFTGKKVFQNHLAGLAMSSKVPLLQGFVADIHPESANPVLLPFISNDLAYLTSRGGTVSTNLPDIPGGKTEWFDGSPAYGNFNKATIPAEGAIITINFPNALTWSSKLGIHFGHESWAPTDIKLEVFSVSANDWVVVTDTVGWDKAAFYIHYGSNGSGINAMRWTLKNWAGAGARIAEISAVNYGSDLLKKVFVGRDGGDLYGTLKMTTLDASEFLRLDASKNIVSRSAAEMLTDLGLPAVTDMARLVSTTASGATGTENGANTWAKLASFDCPNQFADGTYLFALMNKDSSTQVSAMFNVFVRANATGTAPTLGVEIISMQGANALGDDSFKLIANNNNTGFELWVKKTTSYLTLALYELARKHSGTVTYFSNSAWQSAVPVGSVANATSSGLRYREQSIWHTGNFNPANKLDASAFTAAANSFLGNNTGSAAAPMSLTAAQAKTLLALVKADVGLGNVDNTSDANKPVSTAQQTALNLKANANDAALTGTPTAPTAAPGTDTTQIATTAFVNAAVSGVSSGMQWLVINAANVATLLSNTGYVFATDGTLRTGTLPASASVGFNVTLKAVGGQVRIVSNGNTIIGLPAGNDLLLEDGESVTLVAYAAGVLVATAGLTV